MGYVGNQQNKGFSQVPAKQDLTGATGTSLTLSHAVASAEGIDLFINNVRQEPTTAYSVIGTAVTLTGSVVASDDIYVVYNSLALQTTVPPDASITKAKIGTTELDLATIKDSTGTNTAMTIDSSGRILTPANPKFSVYQSVAISNSGGDYTSTATSDVPFDTEEFDVGNCVAISSGAATFTAPVTGYYQFNLMVKMDSTAGSTTVSSYLDVNGALVDNASNLSYRNIEDVQGGGYVTLSTSALIYVQATQTVKPKLHVNTDTSVGLGQGQRFSGFLVG
jgi:hypothetical protein